MIFSAEASKNCQYFNNPGEGDESVRPLGKFLHSFFQKARIPCHKQSGGEVHPWRGQLPQLWQSFASPLFDDAVVKRIKSDRFPRTSAADGDAGRGIFGAG